MARRFLERLAYWATRIGMRSAILAVRIFPHSFIYFVVDSFAALAFYLFHGFRTRSLKNLCLAFGDGNSEVNIRRIAQESLKNFFRAFAELPIILAVQADELREMVSVAGLEHLNDALAKGNGVIVLSAHLGNFFLLGTRLALSGYPVHVLVNQPRDGRFAQLMDEYRFQVLQTTIHARPRREALRQLAQVLRRNEIAIIIADEYRKTGSGIRVPFFGRAIVARRGPVTLALRTGAAVVPAYVVRSYDNRLKLVLEPELDLIRSERDKNRITQNTVRLTEWLEKTVRSYPDQWNWMNIHWENHPNNAPLTKNHHFEINSTG
jgi:Kdo2-lipid IVA lauroyltransferase/acyltransferase